MLDLFSFGNPNSIMGVDIINHKYAWVEFSVKFVRTNECYVRIENQNSM